MIDAATAERQKFIADTVLHNSNEAKRRRAIAWLGPKWILHPKNAIKRKERYAS
jgi:hypothetical protein